MVATANVWAKYSRLTENMHAMALLMVVVQCSCVSSIPGCGCNVYTVRVYFQAFGNLSAEYTVRAIIIIVWHALGRGIEIKRYTAYGREV